VLKNRRDLQTLLYMLLLPALAALQWHYGIHLAAYALLLALAFTTPTMYHNHEHWPLWQSAWLNRFSDLWFTMLQGQPGFLFQAAHIENHHRHNNGPEDQTRTMRFGAHNSLLGFLLHPLQYFGVMLPWALDHLTSLRRSDRQRLAWILVQYCVLGSAVAALLALDWRKALLLVLVPQAVALFFLFGSNYLQHADTQHDEAFGHSRNFLGFVNLFCFNIGLHTAHHHRPQLHWSQLPTLHRELLANIPSQLVEPGVITYCIRRWLLNAGKGPAS
jgi:beta-carotene hydroxylase